MNDVRSFFDQLVKTCDKIEKITNAYRDNYTGRLLDNLYLIKKTE